ncbi:UNVERIFIED_CONTAM: Acetyltransferases [Acetivibrio alkalicellulosi]
MGSIVLATMEALSDCCEALEDSSLFEEYFKDINKRSSFISEGINKKEVYVRKDENDNILGFMRIDEVGMFSKFPLLRLIAVKKEHRCNGIGTDMLKFYESEYKNKCDRIFLCVGNFNDRAKKLYISLGFIEVGKIDGLYKKGCTEYILMKEFIK